MSISRRTFIKGVASSSVVAASLPIDTLATNQKKPSESSPSPLNLLLVFPDEMRAHAQGFKHQDHAITPHLDAFAKQAKVMDQMVSNYPLCSPFRGMLMTGQYPLHNGVTGNTHDYGGKVGIELNDEGVF